MDQRTQSVPGHYRALCCVCGALRRFRTRYFGGDRFGDLGTDRRAVLGAQRCTIRLRCQTCGQPQRHAYLLDFDSDRDYAEQVLAPPPEHQSYDPFRMSAERYPHWTFTDTALPTGVREIIDCDRREVFYDPDAWSEGTTFARAHVLAHLDLGHDALIGSGVADDRFEVDADRLAHERLTVR